jgi:penicillin G amidase
MRRLLRVLVWLVVLLAAVAAGGYWYLRQSLPIVSGTIAVQGISAPIEIVRDADAIPHIRAVNKSDALFGLGYVHAQDRLWQMEFQRRIGHGRLSEVFGAAALPQDRFLRTVGFGRAARSAWDRLPAEARRDIDAYCAGVNAFIAAHHGRHLPPEFTLLRFEPEPWTGADVVVWVKMMAWDLSANYSSELFRHDLMAQVGPARAAQLMPPYPADGPTIMQERDDTHAMPEPESSSLPTANADGVANRRGASTANAWSVAFRRAVADGHPAVRDFLLAGARTEALGSNNWVVDGTMTASGKPLLANDPHLATHIPSLWYLAHISGGDFEVIGATLPGAPAVAIGRNRYIAWGETNVAADVQDLYLEKLDTPGRAAQFQERFEPLRTVREAITVKGAEPVVVDVRITRHGPLISDAINANNAASTAAEKPAPLDPLAFRWTALDDDDNTVVAFLKLNEARNWTEFITAMRDFVTPSQNFVYADVDGHIGYFLPGRIPLRSTASPEGSDRRPDVRKKVDGSAPVEGWTGQHEWIGWIPFDELPRIFDPPGHMIVTANHRPNPQGDRRVIGLEYPEPYRAQRITEWLRGRNGLTSDDFQHLQADTLSLHAKTLLPLLLGHVDPVDDHDRQAVDLLKAWSYESTGDSAAAAIFQAWFLALAPVIVGDDLGPRLLDGYDGRYSYITRFVTSTLATDDAEWCDDRGTPAKESCRQAVTRALHDAVASLRARFKTEMPAWRWDVVHPVVFPHQGLDAVAALRPILNRSIPNGGDWSTVNVGAVDADHQYEQRAIPGYRQIVDLSPANDSRYMDAVGQSGHFLSRHYDDFIKPWQAVDHRPMRMDRMQINAGAIGTLTLVPR